MNIIKEGLRDPRSFSSLLEDVLSASDVVGRFYALKILVSVAGKKGFENQKIAVLVPLIKVIEAFNPSNEVEYTGMSRDEVKLAALHVMGYIWDQDHIWGDTHSTEMTRGDKQSALEYIANKLNDPRSVGRIGAFQTLCLISKSGALIPEFSAVDVIKSILHTLHSADLQMKLLATEILRNFSKFDKLTEYIDTLDLLRNMIDCLFNANDPKITNLLLEAFLNLCDNQMIRVEVF